MGQKKNRTCRPSPKEVNLIKERNLRGGNVYKAQGKNIDSILTGGLQGGKE